MASLTQYQHRRIAFLFIQYSGTVFAEAKVVDGPVGAHKKHLTLESRLTPVDFQHLLVFESKNRIDWVLSMTLNRSRIISTNTTPHSLVRLVMRTFSSF